MSIDDVAAAAGVSRATVSRAFARPERVHEETRQRVLAAAEALNYRPQVRSRSSQALDKTLGLFVPDIANPFFGPFIKAVEVAARQRGYAVMIVDSDECSGDEFTLVETMAARVDGLILMSPRMTDPELQEICAAHPAVVLYRHTDGVANTVLVSDAGLIQAVQQLHTLGHRRVVYLAGPPTSYSNAVRRQALNAAAAKMDVELIELGPFEPFYDEGVRAADLVCAVNASSVIAYNDLIAVGLMSQLAARGLGVGRDISVIGIDDSWLAQMSSPPLTSVNQPVEDTGRTAVRMLVDGPRGPLATAEPRIITLPSRLVLRASLGLGPLSADNLTATGGGARNTAS